MARGRSKAPPRVGVNDEDAFVGEAPKPPPGLDPFDARLEDGSSEREAALELLPNMARVTSTHLPLTDERPWRAAIIAAVLLGVALVAAGVYLLLRR